MLRKAKLVILFYRPWAFASNLATALCVATLANVGIMALPFVLLLKAAVGALIWYVTREFGARTRYYFTNLGLTPRALWGWSMVLDMTIFATCVAITMACKLP